MGGQREETKREGGDRQQKMKVIETLIFVPFTQDSALRKSLQLVDNAAGEVAGSPAIQGTLGRD